MLRRHSGWLGGVDLVPKLVGFAVTAVNGRSRRAEHGWHARPRRRRKCRRLVAGATDVEERLDRHDQIDTDVTEPISKDCPVIIGGAAAALDYGNRSFGSSSPLTKAQAKTDLAFVATLLLR